MPPDEDPGAEALTLAFMIGLALGPEAAQGVFEHMEPEEGVLSIATGVLGVLDALLILTRERILLFAAGEDAPASVDLGDVTAVEWRRNVLRGSLFVQARGGGFVLEKVDRKEGVHFTTIAQGVIGGPPAAGDMPEALLMRLADLYARGLITDAEYAAKRAEVLRRL